MATDIKQVLNNLRSFYDFSGKTVVSVGAGGGQLIEFAMDARKLWAVDSDKPAIEKLEDVIREKGMDELVEPVHCDFVDFQQKADVLIFEFSFHEMNDPSAALAHARSLAPDVIIFDHMPESPWAWQVVEEDKVARSAAAYEAAKVRRRVEFKVDQIFPDFDALIEKVKVMGPLALRRAAGYVGHTNFFIPFYYGIVLI